MHILHTFTYELILKSSFHPQSISFTSLFLFLNNIGKSYVYTPNPAFLPISSISLFQIPHGDQHPVFLQKNVKSTGNLIPAQIAKSDGFGCNFIYSQKYFYLDIMIDLENQQDNKLKLTWKNIRYSVRLKRSKQQMAAEDTTERYYDKMVIDDASGYWDLGQAIFIMGSSGAGKSTLLNILADRIGRPRGSILHRDVKINGNANLTRSNFGAIASYVIRWIFNWTPEKNKIKIIKFK